MAQRYSSQYSGASGADPAIFQTAGEQVLSGLSGLAAMQSQAYAAEQNSMATMVQARSAERQAEIVYQKQLLDAAREQRKENNDAAINLMTQQKMLAEQRQADYALRTTMENDARNARAIAAQGDLMPLYAKMKSTASPVEAALWGHKITQDPRFKDVSAEWQFEVVNAFSQYGKVVGVSGGASVSASSWANMIMNGSNSEKNKGAAALLASGGSLYALKSDFNIDLFGAETEITSIAKGISFYEEGKSAVEQEVVAAVLKRKAALDGLLFEKSLYGKSGYSQERVDKYQDSLDYLAAEYAATFYKARKAGVNPEKISEEVAGVTPDADPASAMAGAEKAFYRYIPQAASELAEGGGPEAEKAVSGLAAAGSSALAELKETAESGPFNDPYDPAQRAKVAKFTETVVTRFFPVTSRFGFHGTLNPRNVFGDEYVDAMLVAEKTDGENDMLGPMGSLSEFRKYPGKTGPVSRDEAFVEFRDLGRKISGGLSNKLTAVEKARHARLKKELGFSSVEVSSSEPGAAPVLVPGSLALSSSEIPKPDLYRPLGAELAALSNDDRYFFESVSGVSGTRNVLAPGSDRPINNNPRVYFENLADTVEATDAEQFGAGVAQIGQSGSSGGKIASSLTSGTELRRKVSWLSGATDFFPGTAAVGLAAQAYGGVANLVSKVRGTGHESPDVSYQKYGKAGVAPVFALNSSQVHHLDKALEYVASPRTGSTEAIARELFIAAAAQKVAEKRAEAYGLTSPSDSASVYDAFSPEASAYLYQLYEYSGENPDSGGNYSAGSLRAALGKLEADPMYSSGPDPVTVADVRLMLERNSGRAPSFATGRNLAAIERRRALNDRRVAAVAPSPAVVPSPAAKPLEVP